MDIKSRLPSRISWLRAVALISTRIILSFLLNGIIYSLPTGYLRTLLNLGAWICFSMLMGVWSHFIFVFQGKTGFWKPRRNSVREAVDALKISLVADLLSVGLIIVCVIVGYNFFAPLFKSENPEDVPIFLGIFGLIIIFVWIVIVPMLYQKELTKRVSSASARKARKSTKQKPK